MKQILSLPLILLLPSLLTANIGPAGFKQFKNYYFVETGTYCGTAVAQALKEGFSEVRSIEFDLKSYSLAQNRFKKNTNVKLFHGNSINQLWEMIKDIDQPITFWLDAHIFPPLPNGNKNCPLLEELDQIKRHHIKVHTILIDDMHCAGTAAFDGLTKTDLIKKILEINPNYKITYVSGGDKGEYPENVMVASIN